MVHWANPCGIVIVRDVRGGGLWIRSLISCLESEKKNFNEDGVRKKPPLSCRIGMVNRIDGFSPSSLSLVRVIV